MRGMKPGAYSAEDFGHSPFLVFYEVTRACDLVCKHCRACAQPTRHPHELTHEQSRSLIEQLATFPKPPLLVLTGGDPFKRPDLIPLVLHARGCGLEVALTPSATPLVTPESLAALQQAGLARLAMSLDAPDAAEHDRFRGVAGSFDRTLSILHAARSLGLPIQVNTTVTRDNHTQIDAMAELLATLDIVLWSVFFLIPVGRGLMEARVTAEQAEWVFSRLWHHAQRQRFGIKTTEAHHYRRYVLQQRGNPLQPAPHVASSTTDASPAAALAPPAGPPAHAQRAPLGVNDGKGVMFISHVGQVFPSGFMPIDCGRFPRQSVVEIYQTSPVLQQLREPDLLQGKCGACDFRSICGGSRARAYAVTGNPLAAEPDCLFQPWQVQ